MCPNSHQQAAVLPLLFTSPLCNRMHSAGWRGTCSAHRSSGGGRTSIPATLGLPLALRNVPSVFYVLGDLQRSPSGTREKKVSNLRDLLREQNLSLAHWHNKASLGFGILDSLWRKGDVPAQTAAWLGDRKKEVLLSAFP